MSAVDDFIKKNFPSYSWVLDVPELKAVFENAVAGGSLTMSENNLTSQLENTGWWRDHGSAYRNYLSLQYRDPATLSEQIREKDAQIHQIANRMGLADNQLNIDEFSRKALMLGWGDSQITEQLATLAKYQPGSDQGQHIGTIDTAISQLKQMAADYMTPIDDATAFAWARDVAAGHHAVQDYETQFQSWAKGRFPTLSGIIDSGVTPESYFAPIRQQVGKLLEIESSDVDLNSPKFQKIISYADPKTNMPRPMTMAEVQTYVRSTDDWWKTKQAHQATSDMTEGLAQLFGKTASQGNSLLQGPANTY